MRIVFINTTDVSGGAAVAMQRLMRSLRQQFHTENFLLVKTKSGTGENTKAILSNTMEITAEKVMDRITRPLGLLYQSFPFSSASILKSIQQYKPDVINLHNTHGAYFATPLIQKISKLAPVVWTLHDMWSFTANASHTFGNMSWKDLKNDPQLKKIPPAIGLNTGSFLLKQKKKVYAQSDLSIVTPSLWLKQLADQSPVFEGKKIYQVYNGIDTAVYYRENKEEAKRKAGVQPGCKTVMFSSHFLDRNNPWKGGTDLLEILSAIDRLTQEKINLLMLGEGGMTELATFKNFNLYTKGYVKDESVMRHCLNAADLFIYPTRADNLPNVLVESIACGTPCITFDIGGNPEIIRDNYNGVIIPPLNFTAFAEATFALLNNQRKLEEFSENCLKTTREKFLLDNMAQQYFHIFQNMIKHA